MANPLGVPACPIGVPAFDLTMMLATEDAR